MMQVFVSIFIWFYRIREKLFGIDVKYKYFPPGISTTPMPMIMDLFWLKRGFLGRNKCFIPKGNLHSERFNHESKYFQTWIGTYFLFKIFPQKHSNTYDKVLKLSQAAVANQESWLKIYGCLHPKTRVILNSVKLIKIRKVDKYNQVIFRGEMDTGLDNSVKNKKASSFFINLSAKVISKYSNENVNVEFLKPNKIFASENDRTRLFGYFSIIEVSNWKYILTYVCGAKENEKEISKDLYKVIDSIKLERA
jgi:hypothetical protein